MKFSLNQMKTKAFETNMLHIEGFRRKMVETFSLHYRRVAKKVAFCAISLYSSMGTQGVHKALPKSPNRLSAGRTLRFTSAQDTLPSGVGVAKGNPFGQGLEPHGSYLGQMVTRPSFFSPRRLRSREKKNSSPQTSLSKTGFAFPLAS